MEAATNVSTMHVNFKPIEELISASKALVRYMKKNGDNNLISKPLVQHVETRWDSNLAMLLSIHEMYEELIKLYGIENRKMVNIDKSLLSKIIYFLIPFKEASNKFQSTTNITINLYYITELSYLNTSIL